jgi:hypothetical protein
MANDRPHNPVVFGAFDEIIGVYTRLHEMTSAPLGSEDGVAILDLGSRVFAATGILKGIAGVVDTGERQEPPMYEKRVDAEVATRRLLRIYESLGGLIQGFVVRGELSHGDLDEAGMRLIRLGRSFRPRRERGSVEGRPRVQKRHVELGPGTVRLELDENGLVVGSDREPFTLDAIERRVVKYMSDLDERQPFSFGHLWEAVGGTAELGQGTDAERKALLRSALRRLRNGWQAWSGTALLTTEGSTLATNYQLNERFVLSATATEDAMDNEVA